MIRILAAILHGLIGAGITLGFMATMAGEPVRVTPEAEWHKAAYAEYERWGCGSDLKSIPSHSVRGWQAFCDSLGYPPSRQWGKSLAEATEALKIDLK